MGDPKRISRKYSTPNHPWQRERIDEEKILLKEYGMKNKKEIWKMNSQLKRFKRQVKNLVPRMDVQAEIEEKQLMEKVKSIGLVGIDSTLDDILGLTLTDVCDRRLQTLVFKKKLARSVKQARQLITHEHITVNGTKITSPSYIVSINEEGTILFSDSSAFKSEDHPERFPMGGTQLANSPVIKKKRIAEEKKAKVKDNKAKIQELDEDITLEDTEVAKGKEVVVEEVEKIEEVLESVGKEKPEEVKEEKKADAGDKK